jgi:hypothetical protein
MFYSPQSIPTCLRCESGLHKSETFEGFSGKNGQTAGVDYDYSFSTSTYFIELTFTYLPIASVGDPISAAFLEPGTTVLSVKPNSNND